jgi:small nuclear ribonucleoprotein (snRNP)-like protein
MSLPTREKVANLIGSNVRAKLDEGVYVEGTLVSADDEGEFVIDTPEGRRHCWPLLDVELA